MSQGKTSVDKNRSQMNEDVRVQNLGLQNLPNEGDDSIDYETLIYQTLVNEGKHMMVLNARRPQIIFNEKELREAAHAEVAQLCAQQDEADKLNGKDKKPLTPDELAKLRNREHAKNTRLRKKAYILKLRELVDKMNRQKELEEKDARVLGEKIHRTQIIRKNAVRLFLSYYGGGIASKAEWSQIADDHIEVSHPITQFRHYLKSQIFGNNKRITRGIEALIADSISLNILAESIGEDSNVWKEAIKRGMACKVMFYIQESSSSSDMMLIAGERMMCKYTMKIEGGDFVGAGLSHDCVVSTGMIQCKFTKDAHKLCSVDFVYDTVGFTHQIRMAQGGCDVDRCIIPNTIESYYQLLKNNNNITYPQKQAQAIIRVSDLTYEYQNNCWKMENNNNFMASFNNIDLNNNKLSSAALHQLCHSMNAIEFQYSHISQYIQDAIYGKCGSIVFIARTSIQNNYIIATNTNNNNSVTVSNSATTTVGMTEDIILSTSNIISNNNKKHSDQQQQQQQMIAILKYLRLFPLCSEDNYTEISHILAITYDITLSYDDAHYLLQTFNNDTILHGVVHDIKTLLSQQYRINIQQPDNSINNGANNNNNNDNNNNNNNNSSNVIDMSNDDDIENVYDIMINNKSVYDYKRYLDDEDDSDNDSNLDSAEDDDNSGSSNSEDDGDDNNNNKWVEFQLENGDVSHILPPLKNLPLSYYYSNNTINDDNNSNSNANSNNSNNKNSLQQQNRGIIIEHQVRGDNNSIMNSAKSSNVNNNVTGNNNSNNDMSKLKPYNNTTTANSNSTALANNSNTILRPPVNNNNNNNNTNSSITMTTNQLSRFVSPHVLSQVDVDGSSNNYNSGNNRNRNHNNNTNLQQPQQHEQQLQYGIDVNNHVVVIQKKNNQGDDNDVDDDSSDESNSDSSDNESTTMNENYKRRRVVRQNSNNNSRKKLDSNRSEKNKNTASSNNKNNSKRKRRKHSSDGEDDENEEEEEEEEDHIENKAVAGDASDSDNDNNDNSSDEDDVDNDNDKNKLQSPTQANNHNSGYRTTRGGKIF